MGAFLSGLLGAAGADIEKQSDRRYQEKRQERLDRIKILELAISNPNTDPNVLPHIFGELDDLAKDAGYKSESKVKDPFTQMGGMVAKILQRRKQQQAQQGQQQQVRSDVQGAPGVTAQPGGFQIGGPPTGAPMAQQGGGGMTAQPPKAPVSRETPPIPTSRFGGMFRTREQQLADVEAGEKRKEAYEERADKRAHQYKIEEIQEQAKARGDKAIGSPTTVVGEDGKSHRIREFQRMDGTRYFEDLGVAGSAAADRPKQAWTIGPNGKPMSILLDPKTNQPMPGTENQNQLPPAYLTEHIRQGEFTFTDSENRVYRIPTTSVTRPVMGGGGKPTPALPPRRTGGATVTPTPAPTPVKPSPRAIPEMPKGSRFIGEKAPVGQAKSRADAAKAMIPLVKHVQSLLRDPEIRKSIGVLPGRVSEAEHVLGNLPPKVQQLYGELKSIYSLAGAMHGWRAIQVASEFERAYGGLHTNPDTLSGGLDAMLQTANEVYQAAYNRPLNGDGAGGPSGATTGAVEFVRDASGNLVPKR